MVNDEITIAQNERFLLQKEYLGENKPINQIQPIVSVTVATYQHVNYIKQCLDGILMQKINFPYEIILGEDGSVDGTQEICKEYAEKYPDKIRLFIRDRKLSQYIGKDGKVTRFNGIWNRMSARGKYIAWCDGDDYWIDPLKLQKQIDYLETNPNCSLVYTKAKIIRNYEFIGSTGYETIDFSSLLVNNTIPTLTVCFRKDSYINYSSNFTGYLNKWVMGDYPMWLYFSATSEIKFLKEETAVYRMLLESASHSQTLQKMLSFSEGEFNIRMLFLEKYHQSCDKKVIRKKIYEIYMWNIFRYYVVHNMFDEAKHHFRKILFAISCSRKAVGVGICLSAKCRYYFKNKWKTQM